MNQTRLTLVTLIALSLCCIAGMAFAAGNPQGGPFANDDFIRCGTVEHGRPALVPSNDQIRQWISESRIAVGGVIPVRFHVIYNGTTGNVSESVLDEQIARLNYNFAGKDYFGNPAGGCNTGYTFVKVPNSTTRTNATGSRRSWWTMTPGSKGEKQAKTALGVNQTSELNLYTCKPGQNLLGWATFPWNLAGNPTMDGVVIHYGSLPGGYITNYNEGGTATHEIGHWIGLYHTFQGGCDGGNCSGAGDLVCDTPSEGTATTGCPTNPPKNTCPEPGDDPIHNYMDYSYDLCYTNFTCGQDVNADYWMSTKRPLIGSGRLASGGSVQMAAGATTGHGLRAVPNPFNPRTKIEFTMQREGRALVRVYDVQGRTVATLVNAALPKGAHRFDFDGDRLASGIYVLQLRIDGRAVENRRITLMK